MTSQKRSGGEPRGRFAKGGRLSADLGVRADENPRGHATFWHVAPFAFGFGGIAVGCGGIAVGCGGIAVGCGGITEFLVASPSVWRHHRVGGGITESVVASPSHWWHRRWFWRHRRVWRHRRWCVPLRLRWCVGGVIWGREAPPREMALPLFGHIPDSAGTPGCGGAGGDEHWPD